MNLDWRTQKEGSFWTISDSLFLSQDPSDHQELVSLKTVFIGRVWPGHALCSSFLDHMPAGNTAVTRPCRYPLQLTKTGTCYYRRHKTLFSLQNNMQNCYRPQEKRRVTTHWMEQCQKKHMIHWIGQCQCRSAEYTGSHMLSAGVQVISSLLCCKLPLSWLPRQLRWPSSVPFFPLHCF